MEHDLDDIYSIFDDAAGAASEHGNATVLSEWIRRTDLNERCSKKGCDCSCVSKEAPLMGCRSRKRSEM